MMRDGLNDPPELDVEDDEELNDIYEVEWKNAGKFLILSTESVREKSEATFICPMCGETATATKASNGHVWSECTHCKMKMRQ